MSELVAGATKPIGNDELNKILEQYLPKIKQAQQLVDEIEPRVNKGTVIVRRIQSQLDQHIPTDKTQAQVDEAKARLEALEGQLREAYGMLCLGFGVAVSRALAKAMEQEGHKEGWRVPPGSNIKLTLPGLARVTLDLKEGGFAQ